MDMETLWDSWRAELVSTGSCWLTKWINSEEVWILLNLYTFCTSLANYAAFLWLMSFVGDTSIAETGTLSFPIIVIFIPLEVEESAINFTDFFLEASKVLRVGDEIMLKEG